MGHPCAQVAEISAGHRVRKQFQKIIVARTVLNLSNQDKTGKRQANGNSSRPFM